MSHWDPKSTNWADVFTNMPAGPDGIPGGNLGVYAVNFFPRLSQLFHFRRDTMSLYVGDYYLIRQPVGTVILLR